MMQDDLDTPVDEALLMGEDPQENEDAEGDAPADAPDADDAAQDDADEAKGAPKEDRGESDHIPKWRFNEINDERKALKAELEALKSQRAEPAKEQERPADVRSLRDQETELESKLEDALMEGDMDKRREIRAEIRKVRDQIDGAIRSEAEARAESKLSERLEADRFIKVAEELASKYPVLDSQKGGNRAAIDMVIELRDAYIAKGALPSKALRDAAAKVVPLFEKADGKPDPATEDPRKAAAIRKGAETNNATPPKGGGVGNRAQAPKEDVSAITQSKWEKLSAAERERLLSGA